MQSQSSVKTLPYNTLGRDFVVADVHGQLDHLKRLISNVNFDTAKDRLLCTGDLIDWGPQSFETLKELLSSESSPQWFHTVAGNHEEMLLNYLGVRRVSFLRKEDFLKNGGTWIHTLSKADLTDFTRHTIPEILGLPHVINVRSAQGDAIDYSVIHAEAGSATVDMVSDPGWVWKNRTRLTWGRNLAVSYSLSDSEEVNERVRERVEK